MFTVKGFNRCLQPLAAVFVSKHLPSFLVAASIGFATVAEGGIVSVTNLNADLTNGNAFVDSSDVTLSNPNQKLYVGGFSATYGTDLAIKAAFYNDFSALASDFIPVYSEKADEPAGAVGLHNSSGTIDASAVLTRHVALWVTTSLTGDFTDETAEHLIYWTSQTFEADDPGSPGNPTPPPKTFALQVRSPDGNGLLAVGEFGNFKRDYGQGLTAAFNTVAIPEPSTVWSLLGLTLICVLLFRRKSQMRHDNAEV